ncbi:electron transport complex subunit RsxC, partial [bacterium]|nr:electron transport complex subunit RsxC [bacterium]
MSRTETFERGIHPQYHKELTAERSTVQAALPKRVLIPLSQHIGAPAAAIVAIGDEVRTGQLIGESAGFVSSPVHSSVSGKVIAIADFPLSSGKQGPCIVIESDGQDTYSDFQEHPDYMNLDPEKIKEIVKNAGIVGLGGAAFPTGVKLSPPKEKLIDAIIINGAECEPYLTADHRLMVEKPAEIVEGLKLLMKTLGVSEGYIGIEENKPDAIAAMEKAVSGQPIEVHALEVKYPQGAEKMLIKAIKDREVPARGLPMDVGIVVQNVGTALAVYEAVRYGKPLIERVVTITGDGIKEPGNMMVRVGTLISDVISQCGGLKEGAVKVIAGGPMMGFAQWTLDVPVVKGTSGILVMSSDEYVSSESYSPCIRCGRCIDVCPMGL